RQYHDLVDRLQDPLGRSQPRRGQGLLRRARGRGQLCRRRPLRDDRPGRHRVHRRRAGDHRDRARRPLPHPLRSEAQCEPGAGARLPHRRGAEEEARRRSAPPRRRVLLSGRGRGEIAMQPEPEDLARLTDTYFLRTKEIVRRFGDREASYAIFMRRPVICTPKLMVDFLDAMAAERRTKFTIELNYAEGDWVGAGEPLIYVTGSLYHLVDLETIYLQKLGPACVAAYNAYAMCVDLPKTAFLAMDARHCAGAEMAEMMAYAASVGSAAAKREVGAVGFIGNATDATAHFFGNDKGRGTMPHALI